MSNELIARNGIINQGGFVNPYKIVTTNYTVTLEDYLIDATSSSPITITLPNATGCTGQLYVIKNSGSANVTVNPALTAQTIDLSANKVLLPLQNICIQSTGTDLQPAQQ